MASIDNDLARRGLRRLGVNGIRVATLLLLLPEDVKDCGTDTRLR